jgi:DNA-binding NtrC family response regulator
MEAPTTTTLPSGFETLVVEDQLRIRNMLQSALGQMGFRATLAASAEEAARLMKQREFDILILDLNLPGMGGLEFLKTVRRQNQQIQAIVLTGFGDLDAARSAIHLDVVEFLTKPCTLGSLEVALDRARKRRKTLMLSEMPITQDEPEERAPAAKAEAAEVSGEAMEDVERRHILQALEKHRGNRAAAASELGISLRKLYYRLKEYERKGLTS